MDTKALLEQVELETAWLLAAATVAQASAPGLTQEGWISLRMREAVDRAKEKEDGGHDPKPL